MDLDCGLKDHGATFVAARFEGLFVIYAQALGNQNPAQAIS